MKFIRQLAIGTLIAELLLAVVLLVGLVVPLPGKVEFKIVQSGSMEPELPVGSVVFITPAPAYAVGDIITFGDDNAKRIPTTHRVVGVEREAGSVRYRTKGDANEEADNGITTYKEVIGKVVVTVPRLGYVLDFARSQRGFTFMVVIPAGLIVLDELITIAAAFRGMRRKNAVVNAPVQEHHAGYANAYAYGDGRRRKSEDARLHEHVDVRARIRAPHTNHEPRMNRAGIDGYSVILRTT